MPRRVSNRELQDYIEGKLPRRHHARIEDHLRNNPESAAQVEKLRRQASQMQKFGKALLREKIPDRLMDAIPRKIKN